MLNTITNIVLVIHVIFSLLLILVVLAQSGKEAGLSSAIAGGNNSYMGKGKSRNLDAKLAAATKWFAAAFILLTIVVLVLLQLKG